MKSLIEGECGIDYQKCKHRGERIEKGLFSYIFSGFFLCTTTILTEKMCKFCLSLWAFDNSIIKKLRSAHMRGVPATSPLKSLHEGTGRRDLSHKQFS